MSWICLFKVLDKKKYWKVTFEITSKCNLSCKHCCTNSTLNWWSKLKEDQIDYFLTDLRDNSISDIYITWWEPFLYPYIDKFLEKVWEKWFNISLATNATLLNEKRINLLKNIINKKVLVSIDGYNSKTHNWIRWNSLAWSKTISNINKLVNKWIDVKISSIVWKENIDYLEDMIINWIDLGVSEIYFVWPIKTWRLKLNNDLLNSEKDYFKTFILLKELKLKYKDKIKVTFKRRGKINNEEENGLDCLWWYKLFHINSDLEVFPCSWMSKLSVSNNYKSIWSIDNDFKKCIVWIDSFRKVVKKRKMESNIWCPALSQLGTWDIYWKDPLLN